MFKTTLTIAILAVSIRKHCALAITQSHRLYPVYQVGGLGTIGTNVLYGRRAYLSGYQRQVLGAMPAFCHTGSHHVVPYLATAHA